MEIIKVGRKPNGEKYEVTCRCASIFRFNKSEALYYEKDTEKGGDYLSIRCPICGNHCHTSVKDFIK